MNASAEEIAVLRELLEQQTALALIHYDTAQKLTAVVEAQSKITEGLLAMVQELVSIVRNA
ncbi:hypothetical protein [Chroococcidiopsis sp.]|uniref:hypothetical protein n=1 Tax=Chroococcidiopsis sp. TaxID=3088168 RepID=UPI003F33B08F